jgi:AraC-like DNA-binding protein
MVFVILIMQYIKYLPTQSLRNLVECYFIWRSPTPNSPIWVESPPSAFTAIIINLAGAHSVSTDGESFIRPPSSFISGQSIRNYSLLLDDEIDQLGIVFKPTGLHHLFGLQMFAFTNTRENLHDVLKVHFQHIEEKLAESKSDQARILLLEDLLLTRLKNTESYPDGVDRAARTIIDNFGNVTIDELLQDAFMSRRKFERHFLSRVGLSPKYYARIRRYGYICSLMAGQRSTSWDKLLYRAGYYDQSHFIKDFKEFSGKSPGHYLQTNLELAHQVQVETNGSNILP